MPETERSFRMIRSQRRKSQCYRKLLHLKFQHQSPSKLQRLKSLKKNRCLSLLHRHQPQRLYRLPLSLRLRQPHRHQPLNLQNPSKNNRLLNKKEPTSRPPAVL